MQVARSYAAAQMKCKLVFCDHILSFAAVQVVRSYAVAAVPQLALHTARSADERGRPCT